MTGVIDTHLSRRCSCCLDGRPPSFLGQKALLCFSHTRLGRFFPALDMTAAAFVAFVAVVAAAEVGGSAVAAVAVGRPWPVALAKLGEAVGVGRWARGSWAAAAVVVVEVGGPFFVGDRPRPPRWRTRLGRDCLWPTRGACRACFFLKKKIPKSFRKYA